jgi:hypothetical protein
MRVAFAAVMAAVWLASQAGAVGPPPGDRRVLDALLAEYRRHCLPLPPKGSLLARYCSRGGANLNGVQQADEYTLAFLTPPGTREQLLTGETWWAPQATLPRTKVIRPTAKAAKDAAGGEHENLSFAVQCYHLGWTELAKAVLARVRPRGGLPLLTQLRQRAWDYWARQIPWEGSDFALIAQRLKGVMAADAAFRKPFHRAVIQSLEAALVPR